MNKRKQEIEQAAREAGLRVEAIKVTRGTHLRIVAKTTDGRVLNYTTGATPGDRRAVMNMRSDFRRFARGGAIR